MGAKQKTSWGLLVFSPLWLIYTKLCQPHRWKKRPEDGKKVTSIAVLADEEIDELEEIITTTKKSDLSYYILVLLPANISLRWGGC